MVLSQERATGNRSGAEVIGVVVNAISPPVRARLESVIRAEPGLSLVNPSGRANSARPASVRVLLKEVDGRDIAAAAQMLPVVGGFDEPSTLVVMDHVARGQLRELLVSGVHGVLSPDADPTEVIAAIHATAAGLTVLRREDLDLLVPPARQALQDIVRGEPLTPRETQVLALMAEGDANGTIAKRLDVSRHTVKFHVSSILGKLGASSRGEAVMLGVRQGLIVI